ncbi:aerobic respiration two-component sensor histidine kinase ArcB [Alteromonas sp. a30]|uniref:aerobic respiration two-component sensor histidine kinase ArcB n=1 Tax=Alteromonas sp. a30 TaxID=2730917 RepID=UPI0022829A2F|nr:aerobic respiration two-component sensor histidine kinase ArcB [Alteromonas sp. a30]MCY7294831.1 aerobic respiration two-component sensor histidine kinase ArcB [Alteromonas sp. a30]
MAPSPDDRDSLTFRVAHLISRMGAFKTSLVFLALILALSALGSYLLRIVLSAENSTEDFAIAVILTLIVAPWVLILFTGLVKQLVRSREDLKRAISELEKLHQQDEKESFRLKDDIERLNHEISKREQLNLDREKVFAELENQVQNRSEKEQQALRLSTLMRSIIDASPDLIYYRNQEGKFAGCNRVAEQLTGKTEEELIGLSPHEVYDEELARQVVASDNEVLESNSSITEELWLRFADGRRRYYEMRKVPFFDPHGDRLGLLAFGRDITERKQAEDSVAKASKDKTAFIATISHELRTPLNGIVGLSRMLRDTELTQEQFNWVSTIYASAITLGNIFNDIIDLDKLERDRLEFSLKTVSLKDFAGEIGSIIELLAADKGLGFEVKIQEPLPEFIEVDGTRLRQILWNLLFNAVKFTQQGKVSLSVEATAPKDDVCLVTFRISDSGIGIPQAELDKIFAMYYQVDHPNHKSATGTGIGLAICHELVTRMKGNITVESEVGNGTTFIVELPVDISKNGMQVEELLVQGLNILLVEDIHLNVMVAEALLLKLGQHVEVAMTGEEAIDKVRHNQYDLILLDIQLPDMTGFEVASKLQEEDLVSGTHIVALTANVIRTRQEYLDNGMDDVIAKPIKKSRVIQVFNQLFADYCPIRSGEVIAIEKPVEEKLNAVLDLELLNTLNDTIGKEMLSTSIGIFKESMPKYLELLQLSLSAEEKDEACAHAHKIKGAASSVGLVGVQKIANQIQQGDHPAWWQNVHDWVEALEKAYKLDVQKLEEWLSRQMEQGD